MGNPRVTALIDTYNQGRFIEEAIESVLAQGLPPDEMEILVVDDGSTDDTPQRIRKYGDSIRYVRKPNGGQASALNVGLAESRGEIIAMLDGDDLWRAGKIRRTLEEFERHPDAGMVYYPYRVWNTQSDEYTDDDTFCPITGFVPSRVTDVLRYGSFGTSCIALRRSVAQKVFPIPTVLTIYADTYLVLLMIFLAPVAAIPEHLTIYRLHTGNLTAFRQGDRERLRQRWHCYEQGVAEARAWLQRNGYDLNQPESTAYFRRHQLTAENFRFLSEGAGRRELYRHLEAEIEVFRPLWSGRYRFYRHMLACAALLLGYERFARLQAKYRGAVPALRLREYVFPHAARERSAGSVSGR
jgi:glycosyltransferase involved in cell wall biosynthesis